MEGDSPYQSREYQSPIRDLIEVCLRSFVKLQCDALSPTLSCHGQMSASEVENFAGRLRLWAGNVGVFEKANKSFDYRLRDSSDIVEEVRELLDTLIEDTREASAILRGEKIPFEMRSADDDEDEPNPDTAIESNLPFNSGVGDTELGQLKDSLKITLRCLATFAKITDHPAPLDFYACTLQRPDSYKKECENLVEGKFPDAPNNLKERLVDTMIIRREYLDYREARTKPDQGLPKDSTGETTDSRPNASKFVLLDEDSSMELVESEEENQIDLPPAHLGGPFKCPLCFLDILVLKTKAWRKHVFEDLRPYICTFDRCGAPLNRFDSRRSWFAHEMEHLSKWRCPESCKEYFDTNQALISHLKDFHDWIARSEIPGGIVEACKVLPGGHSKIRCPLCHDETCFSELQDHLGQHQEHLALFALRPQTTQTELEEHSAALEESTFQENRDDSSIASHSGLSQREESVGGNAELDRDDKGPVQPRMPREHPENSGDSRTNQGVFSGYDRKKTGNENKSHLRTSFVRDEVAGITRPANIAESWALYDFEMHARNCSSCRNPEVVHRAGYQLCDQGSAFARAISKFLYNNDGETYAIAVDKVPQEVRVEIQSGYDEARSLLRAIEHSIRHQRPLLSMERTYLGALQTAAGQRQQSQQQQHLPEAPTATGPTSILLDQAGTSADPKNIKDLEKSQEEPQAGVLTKGVSAFSSKEGEGKDKGESEDVKKSKAEYKNDERGRASHKSRDSEGSRRRSGKPESIDDSLPASPDEQAKVATESLERIGLEIAALEHERERLQRERREKLDRERDYYAKFVPELQKWRVEAHQQNTEDRTAHNEESERPQSYPNHLPRTRQTFSQKRLENQGHDPFGRNPSRGKQVSLEADAPEPEEKKLPIKFKNAVGLQFSYPWHLCKTWKGMEELIKQAFLHMDVLGQHVHDGHYDLVGPDGEIILPQVWETVIQPGWTVSMHMWPDLEPPSKPIPPLPAGPMSPSPIGPDWTPNFLGYYLGIPPQGRGAIGRIGRHPTLAFCVGRQGPRVGYSGHVDQLESEKYPRYSSPSGAREQTNDKSPADGSLAEYQIPAESLPAKGFAAAHTSTHASSRADAYYKKLRERERRQTANERLNRDIPRRHMSMAERKQEAALLEAEVAVAEAEARVKKTKREIGRDSKGNLAYIRRQPKAQEAAREDAQKRRVRIFNPRPDLEPPEPVDGGRKSEDPFQTIKRGSNEDEAASIPQEEELLRMKSDEEPSREIWEKEDEDELTERRMELQMLKDKVRQEEEEHRIRQEEGKLKEENERLRREAEQKRLEHESELKQIQEEATGKEREKIEKDEAPKATEG